MQRLSSIRHLIVVPETDPVVPAVSKKPEVLRCPTCLFPLSESSYGWMKIYDKQDHCPDSHLKRSGFCLVPCPTCSGDAQQRIEARRRAAVVSKLFGASQIPYQAKYWTFATFPGDGDMKAKETVKTFVNDLLTGAETTRRGLWIGGAPGRCKTGLAISAAKEVMSNERSTLFVMTIELMSRLRSSLKKDAEIGEDALLKAVTETELVVLDDVATERPTPYVLEQFYYLVEKRRSNGLWTIFTSNLSTTDLEEYWRPDGVKPGAFHMGVRIVERLREYCLGCSVGGRNQRA